VDDGGETGEWGTIAFLAAITTEKIGLAAWTDPDGHIFDKSKQYVTLANLDFLIVLKYLTKQFLLTVALLSAIELYLTVAQLPCGLKSANFARPQHQFSFNKIIFPRVNPPACCNCAQ
jgi:hypothetical protein